MKMWTFSWAMLVMVVAKTGTTEKCGIKNSGNSVLSGKIIGGNEAEVGEYPWQVSLEYTGFYPHSHFCGGSLIHDSWVLTAAHCVEGFSNREIAVKAGKHDLTKREGQESTVGVHRIITHQDYDSSRARNDICLLRLKKPFSLGKFVGLICLPEVNQKTSGLVIATGWGSTEEGGLISDVLMEVEIPVVSREKCRRQYSEEEISDSMLCAGYEEGRADSCQGDSGGPLIAPNEMDNGYYLAGIVSWGDGCAHPNKSGVYTDVASFRDWIEYHTGI